VHIFLVVVVTVTGLIHWFLYSRLVSALDITSPVVLWTLRALAIFLSQSYILSRILERTYSGYGMHSLEWVASVWIGIWWQLLWMSLLVYIVKIILIASGTWMSFSGVNQEMIGRYAFFAVLGIALLMNAYGYYRAASPARIVEVRVPVENPSPEVQGMRIALASDFHAGTIMNANRVASFCDQISAQNPDLILIPGDIIDTPAEKISDVVAAFRRLKAKQGVFTSPGNHEDYAGLSSALELIRNSGMKLLMNQTVELSGGLMIAGIEDQNERSRDAKSPALEELLKGKQIGKVKVLLDHTPTTANMEAATKAGADLVVCGHTHGGQIWPFSFFTRWAFPLHHGLYPVDDGYVLTTSGIGFWGPPIRIGAPPEIMMIQFVPKDKKSEVVWG
jgi:predicted MPP superfamily phosphohydrolase